MNQYSTSAESDTTGFGEISFRGSGAQASEAAQGFHQVRTQEVEAWDLETAEAHPPRFVCRSSGAQSCLGKMPPPCTLGTLVWILSPKDQRSPQEQPAGKRATPRGHTLAALRAAGRGGGGA